MKKTICILASILTFAMTGCQTQFDQSNSKVDPSQTTRDSAPDSGSTSEGDSVNIDVSSDHTDKNDDSGSDAVSEDDSDKASIGWEDIGGDINSVEIGNDDLGWVAVTSTTGKHELKSEGSLRGEIEITHKLTCGTMNLDEGDTVLFSLDTSFSGAELKIILTGTQTCTVLEGYVTGSGEMSVFEIEKADEYSVVIENCGRSAVQFTIDYSIGGSI